MLDLNPINERLNMASSGPWTVTHNSWSTSSVYNPNDDTVCRCDTMGDEDDEDDDHEQHTHNADLIANAPTDLRACIDEIERLRAENELASAAAQASYDWFYGEGTTEQEQAMCDAWFIWRRSLISD